MRFPLIIAAVAMVAVAGCSAPSRVASVRDGGLEFAVLGVDRARQVGDVDKPGMSVDAKGVFIVATLAIRNAGDSTITFIDRDQRLIDTAGRSHEVSNAADIYGNLDVPSTRMAPGDRLRVRIAFDVPAGTEPASLLLKSTSASNGVRAPL